MIKKYIIKSTIIHTSVIAIVLVFDLIGTKAPKKSVNRNIITFDFVKIGPVSTAHNNISTSNAKQNKQGTTAPQQQKQKSNNNVCDPKKGTSQNTKSQTKQKLPQKQETLKPKPNNVKKQETPKTKQVESRATQQKQNAITTKKQIDKIVDSIATNAEKVGGILTATQADVIKQRLYNTWHIPIGIKNIKNISIDVRIELNSDGYVTNIKIIKTSNCDRADIDIIEKSIYRALYSTEFSPLPFDKKEYNNWKVLDLCFYPGDMV